MIADLTNQLLGSLDPMVIYVCVAVLAITVIIAIVKKAVVMALVVALIAGGVYLLAPAAKDYQENFYIRVNDDNALEIMVDGEQFILGGEEDEEVGINNIEFERQEDGTYRIKIKYNDGNFGYMDVPGFMRQNVISFMEKQGYKYKVIE